MEGSLLNRIAKGLVISKLITIQRGVRRIPKIGIGMIIIKIAGKVIMILTIQMKKKMYLKVTLKDKIYYMMK